MAIGLVFLQMQNYLGASSQRFRIIWLDCERASGWRFPKVLLVIIVLGMYNNFISYQVSGVETYTKLTNHGNISSSLKSFHESFGARLGNGTQVVDQVSFGHANTAINDGKGFVLFVWNNLDEKFLLTFQFGWISKGFIPEIWNNFLLWKQMKAQTQKIKTVNF